MELRRYAVITVPSALDKEDACGVCRWQRENEKQKTPGHYDSKQKGAQIIYVYMYYLSDG